MLNPFYWYTLIWTFVLFLYELHWSEYNDFLESPLRLFLIASIGISMVLGYFFRQRFRYSHIRIKPKRNRRLTFGIIIVTVIEFAVSGNIPLFSIILGKTSYGDFIGIPLVHTLLENLIIFYSSYLFYLYLELKDKSILVETISILLMLLLMFHKGALLFCVFIMVNLIIAKVRKEKKLLNVKSVIFLFAFALMVLYINGGLANLRTGFAWNDNDFILRIGGIGNRWPSIIPKQYCWSYVYITSPLANLNLMVKKYASTYSISRLMVTVIPTFISKRLFPTLKVDSIKEYTLKISALNACTGYAESTVAAGIKGIWFFYIVFVLIIIGVISVLKTKKKECNPAFFAILSMQITFLFFYNTLTTAATSFLIIYMLIYSYNRNVKIVLKRRKL